MIKADIIALGEPLVEMVQEPTPGHYRSGVGGDVLNALVAAARQGANCALLSALGDDFLGEDIAAFCRAEGINIEAVMIRALDPTGVCFIQPDPAGRKFSYARRGSAASLYAPQDLPEDMIAAARILHVSAVSQAVSPTMRDAVQRAAEIARRNDTLVSYDLNLRLKLWSLEAARACIEGFLPYADIVLPSDDEALALTGLTKPEQILKHFGRHGAKLVALKQGAAGVTLSDAGEITKIAAPTVQAVDSAGAGDSFAGAFLAYLLETGDARVAAQRAVRVAAQTVTGFGGTVAIPSRSWVLREHA